MKGEWKNPLAVGWAAVKVNAVPMIVLWLLVANWIVWMPVMVAVYAFPLPLQIQLVGLAGSFWMLVALRAADRHGEVR